MAGTMSLTRVAVPPAVRRNARKQGRNAGAPKSRYHTEITHLAPKVKALREILGVETGLAWWPEMNRKERAAWERQAKRREEKGAVDWVVTELRKMRFSITP